ncbi:nuclear transport factor 2 family protein [Geodermatophilus sp. URMC 64]
MPLTTADRMELHELAARYGDLIDACDWPGLASVFTEDAVFDLTDIGVEPLCGLEAIRAWMDRSEQRPLAHLITNIRVVDGDSVRLHSRVLGILPDRRAGSGTYIDRVIRTPDGWRIRHRDFTRLRRRSAAALTGDGG